jgi:FkbM family methyltransferase
VRKVAQTLLRWLGHQEWLRFGVRNRLIRWAHDPTTATPREFVVPFFGSTYRGAFDCFIDWNVYYYGAYAREELRLFEDVLGTLQEPVVLDVGANVGHHTLFAATRAARVLAFEPFNDVSVRLKRKLVDNALTNVTLIECALGDKEQSAAYVKPAGNNTGTGTFMASANAGPTLSLPVRLGDAVLAEHDVGRVDFIKIDTEGYEPFVLRGLSKTLARHRPVVFFEWTPSLSVRGDKQGADLFPDDYRFYQFVDDTVRFFLLREPTYRLVELTDRWPAGNLLALPRQYVERVSLQSTGRFAAQFKPLDG